MIKKTVTSRRTLGVSTHTLQCFEQPAQITIMSELSYFPCFLSVHGYQLDRACENLSSVICDNKGADQPAHPRSIISNFLSAFLDESYLHLLQEKFQFLASPFSLRDWFKTRFVGTQKTGFLASWPVLLV